MYFKAPVFYFLILFFSLISQAQDRENYSLLWEIENPNNNEISYVFGTMHLSDTRVFEFSDAVFPAIQKVETFALEVHPDSITSGMANAILKKEDLKRYKKVLGKKKYNELNEKIKRITGEPLDSLKFNSLGFLETLVRPDISKEDDKETFLDNFLYKVALTDNKKIEGLEALEDQLTDTDSLNDEELKEKLLYLLMDKEVLYKRELNSLIEIYYSGDIEKIYSEITKYKVEDDLQLISRNNVMVSSIEKITNKGTLFAAIGAAHLPGENGVLELLKKKGFKVTKAIATFEKSNMDLIAQNSLESWKSYHDETLGYGVKAPKKLDILKDEFAGFSGIRTDLINNLTVVHMSIKIPEEKLNNVDSLINVMIDRYKTSKVDFNFEITERSEEGIEYRSLSGTKDKIKSRIDLYIQNGRTYLFTADYKSTINSQKAANRFFESINVFEPKEKTFEWDTLTSETAAFEVDFPREFKESDREIANPLDDNGEPYKIYFYQAINSVDKEQYIVRYNDFPTGYFLEDIEVTTDEYIELIEARKMKVLKKEKTYYQGVVAYDLEVLMMNKFHARLRLFYRGNRIYLLMTQSLDPEKKISMDNRIFNSFKFKDYKPVSYEKISLKEGYSFKFPKINIVEIDSSDSNPADILLTKYYQGYDENSGGAFYVSHSKIGDYFQVKNKEQYLKDYMDELVEKDSIYEENKFQNGVINGLEYKADSKASSVQKYYRAFFSGQNVFLIGVIQDERSINGASVKEFFDSFTVNNDDKFDPVASKSSLLFKNLQSDNEQRYNEASYALDYLEFEKNDINDLVRLMKHDYKKDSIYYGTKNMLIYNLALLKDQSTLKDVEHLYLDKNATENTKIMIIQALPLYESEEAIKMHFDLLEKDVPASTDYVLPYLDEESDSLITVKKHGKRIWEMGSKPILRTSTLNYFARKLEKENITSAFLKEREKELLQWFNIDVERIVSEISKDNTTYSTENLSSYHEIFKKLDIRDSNTLTEVKKIIDIRPNNSYTQFNFYNYYLSHTDKLDKKVIKGFIEPYYYRFEGMSALIDNGKQKYISKSYLKDKEFGHLSVYNVLLEYDENMLINHLGEVKSGDTMYIVYQFNYVNYDDDTNYIALARKHKIDMNLFEQFEVWLSDEGIENGVWKELVQEMIEEWNSEE